jgi:hypothetical protein
LWRRAKAVPSLDLRFAENKSLVDATTGQNLITFTRASSGTFVGSDGLIKSAVTNLLLRSEEFDNASWSKTTATVTANAAIAPNGTLTADKLITDSGASGGRVSVSISLVIGSATTLSCFAKQGETSLFGLFVSDGVTGRAVDFDLATGTISGAVSAGLVASIQPAGDGWYRCVATVTSPAGASGSIRIRQAVTLNDGTSGLFIWGAQVEQSSTVGEYIPTTSTINSAPRFDHNPTTGESLGLLVEEQRTNLLLQSNQFDTTWTNSNSSETASAGTAPDGTNTAWELKDTSDVSAQSHSIIQSVSFTSGTTYTFTVWMKAGTLTEGGIAVPSAAFGAILINRVNLSTGAVISTSVNSTTVVTPFANGWYRIALTATATATASGNVQIRPMNGGTTYIGAGTGTVLIWGAQLEAAAFPTSYIPTTTATVTRSADVASISGSNFSSWYRQDEGTVFADYGVGGGTQNRYPFTISDNTTNNRIALFNSSSTVLNARVTVANVATNPGNLSVFATGASKVAIAVAAANNGAIAASNGGLSTAASPAAMPVVDRAYIGLSHNGAEPLNGSVKRLTYWPTRLSNSTLQSITL